MPRIGQENLGASVVALHFEFGFVILIDCIVQWYWNCERMSSLLSIRLDNLLFIIAVKYERQS